MIVAVIAIGMLCGTIDCRDASAREAHTAPVSAEAVRAQRPAARESDRWLASDKLRHFLASFAAVGYGHAGLKALGAGDRAATAGGLAFAVAAGIAKEIHDVRAGTSFSARDLVWDLAGVAAGLVLVSAAR